VDSTCERITRAVERHISRLIAMMVFQSDGPSSATSTTANGMNGIPKARSVARISAVSTRPP
jgi:hypothetical protein